MYKCPIEYYTDNLIFNSDKSCWAVFKIKGYDYDFLSVDKKLEILVKMVHVLSGIMSEAQILIVPVEQNIKEHFNSLKGRLNVNDILYNTAVNMAEKTEEYLLNKSRNSGEVNDYQAYLIIKLDNTTEYQTVEKLNDAAQYFFKNPINAINVWFNMDTRDILLSKIKAFEKLAENWFTENQYKISMSKSTTEEVQWLFRRMQYRGTNKTVPLYYRTVDKDILKPRYETLALKDEKVIRPLERDSINLFSGDIKRDGRTLIIENDNVKSYQTFLVLTNIIDVYEFPGQEWIYKLQKDNAQVEVCINIQLVRHETAIKKLEKKIRN